MPLTDEFFGRVTKSKAFYGLSYVRYQAKHIVDLRAYLFEKVQMGLVYRVELYEEKNLVPKPNDTVTPLRLWIGGVYPKIWREILMSGIKEYVHLQNHSMLPSLAQDLEDITIWVSKKS